MTLHFPGRRSLLLGGTLLILAGCSFLFYKGFFASADRPNVLLITVDTLRSDHVGSYGHPSSPTPHIDGLAQQGTQFENVYSQTPLTLPSHASILTGTYPQFHGIRDNGRHRLPDEAVTLAEVLKEEGYATGAVVGSFILDSKFGTDQGFDFYADEMETDPAKQVIKYMQGEKKADQITREAISWIHKNQQNPFFLWTHYYDPHTLYDPPSPFKEQYAGNPYNGEIAFTDSQIGLLLEELARLGLRENTLIILTSDHGESFGEHDENGHSVFIYDTTLKVPLILSYPKKIKEKQTIKNRVELVDVMPTLLDLLHIRKNKEIQGESLLKLIQGKKENKVRNTYSESFYAYFRFNWSALQSYRVGNWKYIRSSDSELYQIDADPGELNNRLTARPRKAGELNTALDAFLKNTSAEDLPPNQVAMDTETQQKLLSLGYLAGSRAERSKEPVPHDMVKVLELLNLSDRFANEGKINAAILGYQKVLERDPGNMQANLHLGLAYKSLKEYDAAIPYFKRAIDSQATEIEAIDSLGHIYLSMGKLEEAFEQFLLANELAPDNPTVLNNLGWYYQQKKDCGQALPYFDRALALNEGLAMTYVNRASCYRVQGKWDLAKGDLEKAIQLKPDLEAAFSGLCALHAGQNRFKEAIPYCEKAIAFNPENTDAHNNLGVCYDLLGEHQKALSQFRQAVQLEPESDELHFHLGNAYVNLKQFGNAITAYQRTLELNPGHERAALWLQQLKTAVKKA